ncbi:hypothetical protein E6C27_scaffold55G00720 [Cucumis melo var. makuwa]|uniref:Uncharacterized protein n=1 Tax=Cucumis melo var. makuwa TaxID=1194695 RepID=A0A5A7UD47_CUCMM|nr:hypothetical protein E6C27_scaffold55G00720 [Cucumis melo var. makuwa]
MILAYGVVELAKRKMLMTRWWIANSKSKNVNVARCFWIFQVTRMMVVRVNPRLLGVEAFQRVFLRLCSQAKEGGHNLSIILHEVARQPGRRRNYDLYTSMYPLQRAALATKSKKEDSEGCPCGELLRTRGKRVGIESRILMNTFAQKRRLNGRRKTQEDKRV